MKYARLSALEKNVNTSGAIEMSTSLLPMTTGHASMPALKSISIHQNCQLPITPSVTLGISGFTTSSYGLGAGGCDLSLTKTLNRTCKSETVETSRKTKSVPLIPGSLFIYSKLGRVAQNALRATQNARKAAQTVVNALPAAQTRTSCAFWRD